MTKEEAKDILHRMSEDNYYGTDVQEACKMAVEALSPRPGSQADMIYQAIQDVCHVDNPRKFAEHNQTVYEVAKKALELPKPSLPSNIDEAAEEWCKANNKGIALSADKRSHYLAEGMDAFKAGAELMAGQGWIDDGSMPPETKYEEDTMQGHREWTESAPVLAWDSMYGPRVDATKNGKWMSEQRGGYTGQVCHRIIAWRPISEYKEKQ